MGCVCAELGQQTPPKKKLEKKRKIIGNLVDVVNVDDLPIEGSHTVFS